MESIFLILISVGIIICLLSNLIDQAAENSKVI